MSSPRSSEHAHTTARRSTYDMPRVISADDARRARLCQCQTNKQFSFVEIAQPLTSRARAYIVIAYLADGIYSQNYVSIAPQSIMSLQSKTTQTIYSPRAVLYANYVNNRSIAFCIIGHRIREFLIAARVRFFGYLIPNTNNDNTIRSEYTCRN